MGSGGSGAGGSGREVGLKAWVLLYHLVVRAQGRVRGEQRREVERLHFVQLQCIAIIVPYNMHYTYTIFAVQFVYSIYPY